MIEIDKGVEAVNMEQQYEKEIELFGYFKFAWEKIKLIIIGGVIGAVLVGGYRFADYMKENTWQQEYEAQKLQYAQERHGVVEKMEAIKQKNWEVEMYKADSLLMNINAHYVAKGTVAGFVKAYEDEYKLSNIMTAYDLALNGGALFEYIEENMEVDTEVKYIAELISVESNGSAIAIKVIAKNEEQCQAILKLTTEYFANQAETINAKVGKHTLEMQEPTIYIDTDSVIEAQQQAIDSQLKELNDELMYWWAAYKKLQEPENFWQRTLSGLKGMAVYVVVGGVLGILLVMTFLFYKYLNDKSIKKPRDVEMYLGLRTIEVVSLAMNQKKKEFELEEESIEAVRRLAISLKHMCSGENAIVFTSVMEDSGKSFIVKQMPKEQGNKIVEAPPVFGEAEALELSHDAAGVVLVLRAGAVDFNEARRAKVLLEMNECKILGVVLTKY